MLDQKSRSRIPCTFGKPWALLLLRRSPFRFKFFGCLTSYPTLLVSRILSNLQCVLSSSPQLCDSATISSIVFIARSSIVFELVSFCSRARRFFDLASKLTSRRPRRTVGFDSSHGDHPNASSAPRRHLLRRGARLRGRPGAFRGVHRLSWRQRNCSLPERPPPRSSRRSPTRIGLVWSWGRGRSFRSWRT